MEFTNSWYTQGWQEGMQRQREMLRLQLEQQTGKLSKQSVTRIGRLSTKQMEQLAVALLKFETSRDLARWLREHAPLNSKTTRPPAKGNGRQTI